MFIPIRQSRTLESFMVQGGGVQVEDGGVDGPFELSEDNACLFACYL